MSKYYCFLKKCRDKTTGSVEYKPHMVCASSLKEAERELTNGFEKWNVRGRLELVGLEEFGSANEVEDGGKIYAKATREAADKTKLEEKRDDAEEQPSSNEMDHGEGAGSIGEDSIELWSV